MLRARLLVCLGSPLATLHCSASALQTSLNALGLIAMLQLLPFDNKMAISYWLTFGDPSPLRLGNSNKFDCSRLNRGVSF
jgi:hypothetical protein